MAKGEIGPGGDVRLFLAVCDCGGFARAAATLGLSPSAVAKAVGRLEARLGVRLFERSTRHFRIVEEGILYRDACRAALKSVQAVEERLSSGATEPVGRVRVTLPPLLGGQVVAPALWRLTERHPRLELTIELSRECVDLRNDEADLAVRIGELRDLSGVIGRRIGLQKLSLCAAADYLDRAGRPHTPEDLKSHALIGTASKGRIAPWRFLSHAEEVSWTPDARLVLDGGALALEAIRDNQGIGLVPTWLIADDLAMGRVNALLVDQIQGHRPVHLLWPDSAGAAPPRLRLAIEAAAKSVAQALSPSRTG